MILKSFAQLHVGGCDHTLRTHSEYGPDFIVLYQQK